MANSLLGVCEEKAEIQATLKYFLQKFSFFFVVKDMLASNVSLLNASFLLQFLPSFFLV